MLCSRSNLIALMLIVSVLCIPIAEASFLQKKVSDVSTCLNNATLSTSQIWLNNSGSSVPVTFNTSCTFGCNQITNTCHELPALEYTAMFALLILGFLILFRMIGR